MTIEHRLVQLWRIPRREVHACGVMITRPGRSTSGNAKDIRKNDTHSCSIAAVQGGVPLSVMCWQTSAMKASSRCGVDAARTPGLLGRVRADVCFFWCC